MTVGDLRLECLKLAKPDVQGIPDAELWIEQARKLEAYVLEGQSERPPQKSRQPKYLSNA